MKKIDGHFEESEVKVLPEKI